MTIAKEVAAILDAPVPHWVGDGFPVRSMFTVQFQDPAAISPFLLLDYAGPHTFAPAPDGHPRGVEAHPHRGFETVTIVYQGEIEHRDSCGHSGRVGPGDVQWMTAGSGVVHEEKHGAAFTREGGTLEMIQLWVNLPARLKMSEPRYQQIADGIIPRATLPARAGSIRVIAGAWADHHGPAETATPMNVWDIQLHAAASLDLPIPDGHNAIVLCLRGSAKVAGTPLQTHRCALFRRDGSAIGIQVADAEARLLLLSGEPIDEPVAARGPFVMNTAEEIRIAIDDYRSGRMGRIARGAS